MIYKREFFDYIPNKYWVNLTFVKIEGKVKAAVLTFRSPFKHDILGVSAYRTHNICFNADGISYMEEYNTKLGI